MNIQQQIVEKIKMSNSVLAKEYEIVPNPDFIHRKKIEEAVKNNDGYCPCSPIKNDNTKCICAAFKNQQETGFCHCQQFFKVVKAPTVCLCGSTRFKEVFFKVARQFTLDGYIVTMPMVFVHQGDDDITDEQKDLLDELHKAKIANADLVYILNCGQYIGKSTKSEIEWAKSLNKKIKYLEPQI